MAVFESFISNEMKQYIIKQDVSFQDEIQETSSIRVIKQKCFDALINIDTTIYDTNKTIIVTEDVSLLFDEYDNKLPGPLIKWFINKNIHEMEAKYLLKMLEGKKNRKATAMCLYSCIELKDIKYRNDRQAIFDKIKVFDGIIQGTITQYPMGNGPGFSTVFKPNGSELSYAQLGIEKSYPYSMHAKSIKKLDIFLKKWIMTKVETE